MIGEEDVQRCHIGARPNCVGATPNTTGGGTELGLSWVP